MESLLYRVDLHPLSEARGALRVASARAWQPQSGLRGVAGPAGGGPAAVAPGVKVVFLADRGFADTALLAHLRSLRWRFRIRIKANFGVSRSGHSPCKVENFHRVRFRSGLLSVS